MPRRDLPGGAPRQGSRRRDKGAEFGLGERREVLLLRSRIERGVTLVLLARALRGRAIRLWPGCTTSWRVLVEKPSDGSGTYINAVGFAILDPINPGKVLAAYEWNEDGQPYPMDAVRCRNAGGFPVRDLKIYRGVRPLFESGDTIEIKVTLENGHIMAAVEVNDEPTDGEGTRRGIEMRHYDKCTMLRVEPTERDGRKDDVAPVLGREGTLVVAPFCDLSRGSSASLTWSDLATGWLVAGVARAQKGKEDLV